MDTPRCGTDEADRAADSQHEHAGDRQQVEQIGPEDHIGVKQVVQGGLVELIPGTQDRRQQRSRRPAATVGGGMTMSAVPAIVSTIDHSPWASTAFEGV